MNQDAEKLKGFLFRIIDEHKAACRKHPKFCDEVIPPGFEFSEDEKMWKKWNDEATTHYASELFYEEFFEALNAYEHGDKEHALQEFAQCGAVILRIMETIEKEMESNGEDWNKASNGCKDGIGYWKRKNGLQARCRWNVSF